MIKVAPISVCMIVKNEANQIENCLKSIRPYVKEICVVDTGSSDSTPEIVQKYADKFERYTECNDSNGLITSFSMARQRSYELATQEWTLWIDGDDELRDAHKLIDLIERYDRERNGKAAIIMLPYEYAHDHNGKVICYHFRERLTTPRGSFHWYGPVHEVLIPDIQGTIFYQNDEVTVVHRRDQSKKQIENGRNLRILKSYYEKVGENDTRQLYYLGLEYGNVGDLSNSIKFHKRYVELSKWDDERFLACIKIAEHYQSIGQYDDAIQWGLKASTIKEGWGESYFSLAKSYYFLANAGGPDERRYWEKCIFFSKQGLACNPTKTILFVNPMEREFEIYRYLNFAQSKIGDTRSALESVETALKSRPDDESLKLNQKVYKTHTAKLDIRSSIETIFNFGNISQEDKDDIFNILEGRKENLNILSKSKITEPSVPELEEKHNKPLGHLKIRNNDVKKPLEIIFFIGYGPEPWNPEVMKKKGIGGSETAAVEVSRRLAMLGHSVSVYADCPGLEGKFDGVDWFHYSKYKNLECDVLIISRRPKAVDEEFNIKSKAVICWVHDVGCGSDLTHSRALKIDRFFCLSNWHRDFFLNNHKCVHKDQMIVTRNGIDLNRFSKEKRSLLKRNTHKAVYSSSPDRGMEVAVRVWPKIREFIPDAELHIFYGFQTWEVSARSMNDQNQIDLISRLKQLLRDHEKHGVVFHDRVDQQTLADQYMSAGVWAYSTWFTESSCISAMEAQAAGLRIVTSPIAALNETVGERGVLIPGDWLSESYQKLFVDEVIKAMKIPEADDRQKLIDYANQNFGWDSLVLEWDGLLHNIIDEVERDVLVPYKAAF